MQDCKLGDTLLLRESNLILINALIMEKIPYALVVGSLMNDFEKNKMEKIPYTLVAGSLMYAQFRT